MVPTNSAQIEIHVIEDHPLYRTALVRVLDGVPDMRVGVAAGSVEEFAAFRQPPGAIVTLDLKLPGLSDAAAVASVVQQGFQVLVISASSEQTRVLAAIAAGARGYLTKDSDTDEIRRAVREVAAGNRYVAPALAALLLAPARARGGAYHSDLSGRESQVLAMLAAGERDQDIAQTLAISIRTVRSHLDRIREKTGHRRRSDLTRLAIEKGLFYEPVHHRERARR
jgi:DNA-binding NarL/FixJ family response regulator